MLSLDVHRRVPGVRYLFGDTTQLWYTDPPPWNASDVRMRVFLSSCFADEHGYRLEVRDRIASRVNVRTDKQVWLAEDFHDLDVTSGLPPLEKAMFCIKGVRECDAYVAVVIDKLGSEVALRAGRAARSSFFELELYAAAVMRKPAFVYVLEGTEPQGKIAAVLDLLGPALPGYVRHPVSENEIVRTVEALLRESRFPVAYHRSRYAASHRQACERTALLRHRRYDPRHQLPKPRFLGSFVEPERPEPNTAVIETALAAAERSADHEQKLALLWMAVRELMSVDMGTADPDTLALWERVLAAWSSSGAWYGLHGHSLMGCLGAIASRAEALLRLGFEVPHGAFASETYSIATTVRDQALRRALFNTALAHIDVAIEAGETSGKVAIRGSILGRLGQRSDAILALRRVLELRQDEGASSGEIGEAQSELGFALLASQSTRSEGLRLLEDGAEATQGRGGFHVRARRKLAIGYLRSYAFREAYSQLVVAHKVAVSIGAFDQVGRLEQLAARVDQWIAGT